MTSKKHSVTYTDEKLAKKEICNFCNNCVKDNDKGLMCEACKNWFHCKCVGMNVKLYELLQSDDAKTVHFFCQQCDSTVLEFCSITARCDKIESNISEIKNDLTSLKQETAGIKNDKMKLNDQLNCHQTEISQLKTAVAEIDDSFRKLVEIKLTSEVERKVSKEVVSLSEIIKQQLQEELVENVNVTVKSQVVSHMNDVSSELSTVHKSIDETREKAEELRDKEKRSTNIIIYRVNESEATRKEDRHDEDIHFCSQLLNILGIDSSENAIKRSFRLGERKPNYCRPILLELDSRTTKNYVMESLSKLADAEEKFKKVIVTYDMTKKEREKCKELVAKAKQDEENDESGDFIYRVRGRPEDLRIVRFKN